MKAYYVKESFDVLEQWEKEMEQTYSDLDSMEGFGEVDENEIDICFVED